jgi:cyclohexyl-isocyanide hydratase
MARGIQLSIEYDPKPPFDSGHPRNADPKLVEGVTAFAAKSQATRTAEVEKAAARLQPRSSPAPRR